MHFNLALRLANYLGDQHQDSISFLKQSLRCLVIEVASHFIRGLEF